MLFGGSSFAGLTVAQLLYYLYDVFCTYNQSQAPVVHPEFFWTTSNFLDKNLKKELTKTVERLNPDFIINFASIANSEQTTNMVDETHKINVISNKYLTDISASKNIYVIFISTDHVFEGISGPYSEEISKNQLKPVSLYGKQKFEAEKFYYPLIKMGKASIIRSSTMLGISEPYQRENIYFRITQDLLKNKKVKGATNKFRTPTIVLNLGFLLHYIMENSLSVSGIFHLPGPYMSEYQLFQKIAHSINCSIELIIPYKIKNGNNYPLNAGLLSNFGSIRYLSLDEGLKYLTPKITDFE